MRKLEISAGICVIVSHPPMGEYMTRITPFFRRQGVIWQPQSTRTAFAVSSRNWVDIVLQHLQEFGVLGKRLVADVYLDYDLRYIDTAKPDDLQDTKRVCAVAGKQIIDHIRSAVRVSCVDTWYWDHETRLTENIHVCLGCFVGVSIADIMIMLRQMPVVFDLWSLSQDGFAPALGENADVEVVMDAYSPKQLRDLIPKFLYANSR